MSENLLGVTLVLVGFRIPKPPQSVTIISDHNNLNSSFACLASSATAAATYMPRFKQRFADDFV